LDRTDGSRGGCHLLREGVSQVLIALCDGSSACLAVDAEPDHW